jgi:hypothetical protein
MDAMQIFWKNTLVIISIPIFAYIPVSVELCSSGVFENYLDAIYEIRNNDLLSNLVIGSVLTFTLNSFLSLYIIKMANAM